ncbi:MAG: hypothetical protein LRY55_02600 [Leadbetterella sp.]|nr:hypothetical protein [Leadbetterella sp.]
MKVETPACLWALGGSLKSTFSVLHHRNLFTSQYLGDTENFDTQMAFEATLRHLTGLLEADPDGIITDLHPGYFTTGSGESLAAEKGFLCKRCSTTKAILWPYWPSRRRSIFRRKYWA